MAGDGWHPVHASPVRRVQASEVHTGHVAAEWADDEGSLSVAPPTSVAKSGMTQPTSPEDPRTQLRWTAVRIRRPSHTRFWRILPFGAMGRDVTERLTKDPRRP